MMVQQGGQSDHGHKEAGCKDEYASSLSTVSDNPIVAEQILMHRMHTSVRTPNKTAPDAAE